LKDVGAVYGEEISKQLYCWLSILH